LELLLKSFSPAALCLQETLQGDNNVLKLRYYTNFYKNSTKANGTPGGGVAILVKNTIPHSELKLTTNLQATAVRITLHRTLTLCSLYLPPSVPFDLLSLCGLVNELPPPFLLMGDFNAHNPLWGGNQLDNKGKIVEDLISTKNLVILNTNTPTYMHPATGTKTSIDLTICHPSIALDFSWSVHNYLCSSDHFPLIVTCDKPLPVESVPRWKIEKGDWPAFQALCSVHLDVHAVWANNDPVSSFMTGLIKTADATIPKTKPG
jgi:endonuclease/exonuclease/phosphatase family metal-dependent hydrolase